MKSQIDHYLDALDPWASRFIRGKVHQLIRQAGFRESDREDLYHRFAADLIRRRPRFNPRAGTWEAFVIVVCENCFAAILEHACAKMRTDRRECGSLNQLVEVEGEIRRLSDTVPADQATVHTGQSQRSDVETKELQLDVAAVIASLPPRLRMLCEVLIDGSKRDAARALGIRRPSTYYAIRQLRRRFEEAGLRDYL